MSTRAAVRLTRGETFTCALEASAGDMTGAVCLAALKPAAFACPPGDATPAAATFTVTEVPSVDEADADAGPGWLLILDAATTETLTPGPYLMDARVTVGAVVSQTDLVGVTVDERVTEAA